MFGIQKGIVQAVNAARHEVRGTLSAGAEFVASYYGASPVIGDIVFVAQASDRSGSWIVITGPTSAQGLFGVGGDLAVTITAASTTDTVSRSFSATIADGSGSVTHANAYSITGGSWTSADVGRRISGTGIASGTRVASFVSSTSVTTTQALTAAGSSVTVTVYEDAPSMFSVSGSTVTLSRDIYCTNLTLSAEDGDFELVTNGYRIFCLGTLFIDAGVTVHNNGLDASGTTGGGNARANSIGRAVGAGANAPGASADATGTAGTAVTASAATISATAIQSGGAGGYVYNVVGTTIQRWGGTGGTIVNALTNGWPAYSQKMATLDILAATTLFAGGAGGGSGAVYSGTSGWGTGRAGAGGGGGGVVGIYARQLVNFGTISSNGGAGSAATAGTATDCGFGGGGGGGGGVVVLVYGATGSTIGQITATGGASGGGFAGTGGTGSTIDPGDSFYPISTAEFIPGGGAGGAGTAAGSFRLATDGTDGQAGLIWALPL